MALLCPGQGCDRRGLSNCQSQLAAVFPAHVSFPFNIFVIVLSVSLGQSAAIGLRLPPPGVTQLSLLNRSPGCCPAAGAAPSCSSHLCCCYCVSFSSCYRLTKVGDTQERVFIETSCCNTRGQQAKRMSPSCSQSELNCGLI
jgi:hypothetical protein